MARCGSLMVLAALAAAGCTSAAPSLRDGAAPAIEGWAPWPQLPPEAPGDEIGARIAAHAAALVGLSSLREVTTAVPDDCSGFVRYVYGLEGLDLLVPVRGRSSNATTAIWGAAQAVHALGAGALEPGDLLFFRQTYDRNRNGRLDEGLTHLAIVEAVDADGTVSFIHRSGQGVTRSRMNLASPHQRNTRLGVVLNDYLRPRGRRWGPALASELFAGAASAGRLQSGLGQPLRVSAVSD